MQSFQVLDREQNIHKSYILEASAGTGKTFSIENIVVRLLVEEKPLDFKKPLDLEKILVVTFTKAATRDLKARIRQNIEKCLDWCDQFLWESPTSGTPDYLLKIFEEGEESTAIAKRRLERALFAFDQAQIFTIHSFCARMLSENVFEGNLRIDAISVEEPFPQEELLQIIHDFFRTEMHPERYGQGEIKIILKEFGGSIERLEKELLNIVLKGIDIAPSPPYLDQLESFKKVMLELKQNSKGSESFLNDFYAVATGYKGLCDRSRQLKPEILKTVIRFSEILNGNTNSNENTNRNQNENSNQWSEKEFDWVIEDQLSIINLLTPEQRSVRGQLDEAADQRLQQLFAHLKRFLTPLIHPSQILARMGYDCQRLLRRHIDQEEKFGFDDILKAMHEAIKYAEFKNKVRERYSAAIVDEFQDTDPLQWEIFRDLFLGDLNRSLYLVGDPKQSIYAFRQADIYTYLSAVKSVGEDSLASLDTNYRSQPSLVNALNALFSEKNIPELLTLPALNQTMVYPVVKSSPFAKEKKFSDDWGAVHFFIAETFDAKTFRIESFELDFFFPFIVSEILRLHHQDGILWNQFAILVSDRFQGERVKEALKKYQIPVMTQRSGSLADSPALPALRELIRAVINPRHDSAIKTALGGKILRWNHEQILDLDDLLVLESVLNKFYSLKNILYQEGVAPFFQSLFQSVWMDDGLSVSERLLSQEESVDFFSDLNQIAEILFEFYSQQRPSIERLMAFLDDFQTLYLNDDDRLKRLTDPTESAVSVMTLHASKGLEFDVVFTLGLIKRGRTAESMIPVSSERRRCLVPVMDSQSSELSQYCSETDSEKIRQLYVAMTRAKYRLYNPMIIAPNIAPADVGSASPMDLYLSRFTGEFMKFLAETIESITYSKCDGNVILSSFEAVEKVSLKQPESVIVPDQRVYVHSFTGLVANGLNSVVVGNGVNIGNTNGIGVGNGVGVNTGNTNGVGNGVNTGNTNGVEDELRRNINLGVHNVHNVQNVHNVYNVQNDDNRGNMVFGLGAKHVENMSKLKIIAENGITIEQVKNPHTLPSGSEIGTLLHTCLEKIDFSIGKSVRSPKDFRDQIYPLTEGTPYHDWIDVICEMIFNTLRAELQPGLRVCDISHFYREAEFLYPSHIPEAAGYIKGFIDLLFEHQGRYYILDWKSNWLGPSYEYYSIDYLETAMKEHDYFLQAELYTIALRKYLALFGQEDAFGGVFYVFLRGIDPKNGGGIYVV